METSHGIMRVQEILEFPWDLVRGAVNKEVIRNAFASNTERGLSNGHINFCGIVAQEPKLLPRSGAIAEDWSISTLFAQRLKRPRQIIARGQILCAGSRHFRSHNAPAYFGMLPIFQVGGLGRLEEGPYFWRSVTQGPAAGTVWNGAGSRLGVAG